MSRICSYALLLLGAFCFCFSAIQEHSLSLRPPTSQLRTTVEGHLAELNRSMTDLQQTVWAGNIKVFGGLCLVAFAILVAAAERGKASEKAPTPNKTPQPAGAAVPASSGSTSLQTAPSDPRP
jgi:hypothetical protein